MDTILINGKIYTMNKQNEVAEAIAIKDTIIEMVGSSEEILALKRDNTKVIDLRGN